MRRQIQTMQSQILAVAQNQAAMRGETIKLNQKMMFQQSTATRQQLQKNSSANAGGGAPAAEITKNSDLLTN